MNDEQLVHLVGYAAIVVVLASASWGPRGNDFWALFVIAVLVVLGRELFQHLTQRLRAEAEAAANQKPTATDGGEAE